MKVDLSLYDLSADPGETMDVKAQHPDVVKRLEAPDHDWKPAFHPADQPVD